MCAFLGSGFCVLNPEIKIRYLSLLIPNIPVFKPTTQTASKDSRGGRVYSIILGIFFTLVHFSSLPR